MGASDLREGLAEAGDVRERGGLRSPAALVDYAKSLDCIHCGLCLQTCPTFRLTGAEPSSPRGRIHLMRAVAEDRCSADEAFAEEMDFCLLCRHCESVCPAGVRFGEMMEVTRDRLGDARPAKGLARVLRWLGFRVVLPRRWVLRLLGSLIRLTQVLGLDRVAARFAGRMGRGLGGLPEVPPLRRRALLPARVESEGRAEGHAGLLQGCVMPELFAATGHATAASLSKLGVTCHVPPEVVCCGSLHAHNGDLEGARRLARRMISAFEAVLDEGGAPAPVVVNSAGCGAHMKECAHLFREDDPWHARAAAFAGRVVDYTELVAGRLASSSPRSAPAVTPEPVTWDDPCHLCHGQGVRLQPREILDRLGLDRVELTESESCCGSAGLYSLLRPEDSEAVFERKLEAFRCTGARTLVTSNPGCQLQWHAGLRRAGLDARVVHVAELVDATLDERR